MLNARFSHCRHWSRNWLHVAMHQEKACNLETHLQEMLTGTIANSSKPFGKGQSSFPVLGNTSTIINHNLENVSVGGIQRCRK